MTKTYHINLDQNDIKGATVAILTGDPKRVEKIANYLDNPVRLNDSREYVSYLGSLNNKNVVVISHGIGCPSIAIVVEELAQIGITTLIRIGTSGGMQEFVSEGDIIVVQAAIRAEGTSREYLPIEFPAVANIDVTNALRKSANDLKYPCHVGIVQCKDSFYGQHNPDRMPVSYELLNKWQAWIKGGALASEMETAALFIVSSTLGLKAGAVLAVIWNQEKGKVKIDHKNYHDPDMAIKVAIKAIDKLLK